MTNKQIIEILKNTVGYNEDFVMGCIGSSLPKETYEVINADPKIYSKFYYKIRKEIESLPWISVKDKLPEQEGNYLTLLDCNEHEVDNNHFNGNYWSWCHRHVCYWMPIPEDNDKEIDYKPSVMDWHDGGQH